MACVLKVAIPWLMGQGQSFGHAIARPSVIEIAEGADTKQFAQSQQWVNCRIEGDRSQHPSF